MPDLSVGVLLDCTNLSSIKPCSFGAMPPVCQAMRLVNQNLHHLTSGFLSVGSFVMSVRSCFMSSRIRTSKRQVPVSDMMSCSSESKPISGRLPVC